MGSRSRPFLWEWKGLWRPYRAWPSVHDEFPGRCPGLVCSGPFGATRRRVADRLITMNENPIAGSFKRGARGNRMNPNST